MIEDIRKIALKHAMELSRTRVSSEASDIIKDASVFEAYLCGAAGPAINNNSGSSKPPFDLGSCDRSVLNGNGGKVFPVSVGQGRGHDVNQSFSGRDVTNSAHENNSSQKENTSGPELPTPGSTETVIPGGGAVTEPGTHGRTDGGAL
ncbi:hypothetical protein ACLEIY_16000 [Acetobacter tropicalis]|uniref:hypothetical protein n=1 Tax=Acetobacter tropicalis TaxID=104102 RepID=UPI00397535AB